MRQFEIKINGRNFRRKKPGFRAKVSFGLVFSPKTKIKSKYGQISNSKTFYFV